MALCAERHSPELHEAQNLCSSKNGYHGSLCTPGAAASSLQERDLYSPPSGKGCSPIKELLDSAVAFELMQNWKVLHWSFPTPRITKLHVKHEAQHGTWDPVELSSSSPTNSLSYHISSTFQNTSPTPPYTSLQPARLGEHWATECGLSTRGGPVLSQW